LGSGEEKQKSEKEQKLIVGGRKRRFGPALRKRLEFKVKQRTDKGILRGQEESLKKTKKEKRGALEAVEIH